MSQLKHVEDTELCFEFEVASDGALTPTFMSHAFLQLHGYAMEELAGEKWKLLTPPGFAPKGEGIVEELRSGRGWDGRFPIRSKDGRIHVLEFSHDIERFKDGHLRVTGIAVDITDRISLEGALDEREERLKLLNKAANIIQWTIDTDLRLTWSWGSGLTALGIGENELVGTTLYEVFETEDPSHPPIAAALRALRGESVSYEWMWRERIYKVIMEPKRDDWGEIVGAVGVSLDLTELMGMQEETTALVQALATERDTAEAAWHMDGSIVVGDLEIDPGGHVVKLSGREIQLTPTEFKLLVELARRPGRVLSREVLLSRVWGYDFLGGGSLITMAIKRLRGKVETDPSNPKLIETVRGLGYRLVAP